MNRSGKYRTSIKPALILIGLALLLGSLQAAGQTTDRVTLDKGQAINLNIYLPTEPYSNVSVTVSSRDAVDTLINPTELIFTPGNYSITQTAVVSVGSGASGSCTNCEELFHFKILATGGGYTGSPIINLIAHVKDPDSAAQLVLSKSSMTLPENGGGAVKVRLQKRPTANVTVSVSSADSLITGISPSSLTFTPDNWDDEQEVDIRTGEAPGAGDVNATVSLSASGGNYSNVQSSVSITVDGDSQAGLTLSAGSLQVPEGGDATFTVKLAAQPRDAVLVELVRSDPNAVRVSTEELNFFVNTPPAGSNFGTRWDVAQTVTVTGLGDGDSDDETLTINLSARGEGSGYGGVSGSISVTVLDRDRDHFVTSVQSLRVQEGGAGATFTVRMQSRPSASRSISVQSADAGAVTASPAALNFSTTNWNQPQTVTVQAVQDSDAVNERVDVNLAVVGGGHTASVAVSVIDDEGPGLSISPTSLTLTEGERGSFSLSLDSQPAQSVSVALTQPSNTDVKILGSTELTFTTANWNQGQTVTVVTEEDVDIEDESASISMTALGGDYEGVTGSLAVTVTDDDAVRMIVSPGTLSLDEGENDDFTVRLQGAPNGDIQVIIYSSDDGAASASPATLDFTTSDWGTDQTVTVTAVDDGDVRAETATIHLLAVGAGTGTGSVAVNVADDDERGLTVSSASVPVVEGRTATFTVKLDSRPSSNVAVSVTSDSTRTATAAPASLIFTTDNWSRAQTVTVTGVQDSDAENGSAKITLSASSGGYDGLSAEVAVTVADSDQKLLDVSEQSLEVNEGDSGTFKVKLKTRPTGSVSVAIAETGNADVSADPTSLTFTTGNWNADQTVTVRAVEDDDGVDDTASVTLTASGGGYAGVSSSVAVSVADNDRGLTIVAGSDPLSVDEGGSNTFTVQLKALPSGNVRVAVAETSNADVSAGPTPLTFTTTDWNSPQTVTVSATEDDDGSDDTASVTLTASGGGYTGVEGSVAISVIDNDRGLTIVSASDPLIVDEGDSNTFTVRLTTRPTGSVSVAVAETSNADVSAAPTPLTFTTGNWNATQTVTVTATEDDDGADDTASVTLTASGADYAGVSGSVAISVIDNDRGLTIVSASDPLSVDEGGSSTFTVQLKARPSGSVSVAVAETSNADVSAGPTPLTFTTGNWNSPQTVTVRAVEDDDGVDDTASVTLTATGADYAGVSGSVAISVIDSDRGLTIVSASDPLTVDEGGSNTFTVRLKARPSGNVSVAVAETGNADISADPAELTFTTTDWNSPQTVTVTATEDDDGVDDTAGVTLTASGGGYTGVSGSVAISVADNDRGLTIVSASDPLSVDEGGSSTFTVQLKARPSDNVRVAVAETGNADVSAGPAALTFTTGNWNSPQTVTVSATDDDDGRDDTASVTLTASGGGYAGVSGSVAISVADNDRRLTIVSESDPLAVNEGGSSTFTVQLATQPSGSVRVAVAETSNADVSAVPASLTFTTTNWNAPQMVTVTATEDDDGVDDTAGVTLTASGGDYAGVSGSMTISVTDNDTAGLKLSTASLTVNEGLIGSFKVALGTRPSANVTVSVTSDSPRTATALPASLIFTADNWGTEQTVFVTGIENNGFDDASATIALSASGGDYRGLTGEVAVAVINNDHAVLLSHQSLSVPEGGAVEFTARLATQPSAAVTVAVEIDDATVARVSVGSGAAAGATTASTERLSFTASNWNRHQAIRVEGLEDDDRTDDTATISLAASGAPEYADISVSLATTVREHPDAELVLSAESLSVMEGGQASFGVKLSARPLGDVTVSLSLPTADSRVIRLSSDRLTFTADNWGQEQRVNVTGLSDPLDRTSASATVSLTATGGGYGGRTAGLAVAVMDSEGAHLEVAEQVLADAAWSALTSSTSTVASRLDSIPGQRTAVLSGGRRLELGSGRGAEAVVGLVQSFGADAGSGRAARDRSDPNQGGADRLGGIALKDGRPSAGTYGAAQGRGSPSLSRFDYALGDTGARVGWSVWGSLDEQDFSGTVKLDGNQGGSSEYDGSQSSIWLGLDRRLDERWMWGAAFAQSSAEVGYSAGSGGQRVEMDLSILLSYGQMSLRGGGSLNAVLGTGWGEMQAVNGHGRRAAADLSLSVLSLAGSWPVSRLGRSTLSVTGGLGQGQLSSAGASGGCTGTDCARDGFRGVNHALVIGDLSAVHTHISAGVRLSHQGLGDDWSLRPRFELALRQDMGDGPGGVGIEFSGSAELATPQERVSLSVDTHSLILHTASEVEQRSGYRLHLRLRPRDAAGRGLSFALGPEWGPRPDQGALQREDVFLESRSDAAHAGLSERGRPRTALSATLGYGWGLRGGMLTPYAEYRAPGSVHGATRQTAGLKFLSRSRLQGHAFGERSIQPDGRVGSRLRFELRRLF